VFRPVGFSPPKAIHIREFSCVKVKRLDSIDIFNSHCRTYFFISVRVRFLKHKGYEEIIQVYSKHVNQSIRLLDDAPYIEFDWIVGRLDPK
jgi:hypothetical protein